jgi:hypothetical protein
MSTLSRRAAIMGITLALISENNVKAAPEFGDYVNAEYPPVAAASEDDCPEAYAWDFSRQNRCVSMRGWCNGEEWTCEGKPANHAHPQFACLPEYERAERCARVYQPREEGITPMETHGKYPGRCCWRYKPRRI